MHIYISRVISAMVILFSVSVFAGSLPATAQVTPPQNTNYGLQEFDGLGVGKTDNLKGLIANIINIALGFLGIIAVVIILYSGFKWMTAAGNEEQVSEARQALSQAVVGLVIIFFAWAIANFVLEQLQQATGVRR